MTRRDIIIIAVLANAGLLAVLFMMAIHTDQDPITEVAMQSQVVLETPSASAEAPIQVPISLSPNDEVDQAIHAFAANSQPQVIEFDEELTPFDEEEPIVPPKEPEPLPAPPPKHPETKVATADQPNVKIVEVTVKSGDTLDKIAKANGTTVKAIREASGLKSDKLKIGQVLKVPVGNKKVATAKPATKDTQIASSDTQYYTVKSGDNPWKIAKQFHMKVDELLKLNNMDEEKARNMKVGDRIRVK